MRCSASFILAACGLLFAGGVQAQENLCSQNTVVGTYALAYQGTVFMTPVVSAPSAGVAQVSIDPEGNIAATGYQTIGGQIAQGPMPGRIEVHGDCTASIYWQGDGSATANVLNNGDEINSMMVASGKPMVVYGTWKRISRTQSEMMPPCSVASISGIYAFRMYGSIITTPAGATGPVPLPVAHVGSVSIGHDGKTTGKGTASLGGQVISYELAGNTVVNADCTFTTPVTITSVAAAGQGAIWGVVLQGHEQLLGIITKDAAGVPICLGTWTRISAMPNQ
jgi:hypothetical protein